MNDTGNSGRSRSRFTDDIFISYAWKSNIRYVENPTTDEVEARNTGWVTQFHVAMKGWFNSVNPDVEIFQDQNKMETGTQIPDAIIRRVEEAAIFMGVLTGAYIKSAYCREEATHFFNLYGGERVLPDPNQTRIFNIAREPVKTLKKQEKARSFPEEFFDLKATEFFEFDATNRELIIEDKPEINYDPHSRFGKKLSQFCSELNKALCYLKSDRFDQQESFAYEGEQRYVYLAHTTRDLLTSRYDIRIHLQKKGYTIQQVEQSEALTEDEFQQEVVKKLNSCCLSIHLFNEVRGRIDEGFKKSLIQWEYEIAKTQENSVQIAWMPPDKRSQITQQDYEAFIDDVEAGQRFLVTGFEELKNEIDDVLNKLSVSSKPTTRVREFAIVYLIRHPNDDIESIDPILQALEEHDCDVDSCCVNDTEINQHYQQALNIATGILIYWGTADQSWVRARIKEIRTKNRIPISVYITESDLSERRSCRFARVEVIRQREDFEPSCLEGFISRLN